MLSTTLAGLKAHSLRLLLTSLAIMLGVGFIVGTFVLTDMMESGYDRKFAASAGQLDVVVRGDLRPKDLAAIRALPGVEQAAGTVRGPVGLLERNGDKYGDGQPPLAVSLEQGRLARFQLTEGTAPGPGEVALDQHVAANTGFRVGDTVTVVDAAKRQVHLKVTGLADFGLDVALGFRGGLGLDVATATALTGEKGFVEIDVVGSVTTAAVSAAVPHGDVLTGAKLSQELSDQNGADIRMIRTGLLAFGLVALLVSGLVIYNTFAIIITQRLREFALLRCVGATRRQIFLSVLLESLAVGIIGSVVGIAVGLGLGAGALRLFNAFGADLPVGSVRLAPVTVLLALTVGIFVTVVSAILPARSATRIAPVRALGDQHEPGTARFKLGALRWTAVTLLG
ncbi:FtsX-like permease family protein, partial [Actinocorallia lasiicapitis]